MKQLKDQESVLRFAGRKTAFEFMYLVDGVASYKSCIMKMIDGNLYDVIIEVFYEEGRDLLRHEMAEDILYKKQVFQLLLSSRTRNDIDTIYHKKYIDPKSN